MKKRSMKKFLWSENEGNVDEKVSMNEMLMTKSMWSKNEEKIDEKISMKKKFFSDPVKQRKKKLSSRKYTSELYKLLCLLYCLAYARWIML